MVTAANGHAGFEWPRYCDGWKDPEIKRTLGSLGWTPVEVDGCTAGVLAQGSSERIKKPWLFTVSSPLVAEALDGLKWDGSHSHAPCAGSDTLLSGLYPVELAGKILNAFSINVVDPVPAAAAPQVSFPSASRRTYEMPKQRRINKHLQRIADIQKAAKRWGVSEPHRPKIDLEEEHGEDFWCSLITLNLHPSDPHLG